MRTKEEVIKEINRIGDENLSRTKMDIDKLYKLRHEAKLYRLQEFVFILNLELINQGISFFNNREKVENLITQCEGSLLRIKNKSSIARYYLLKCNFFRENGKYGEAIETANKAIEVLKDESTEDSPNVLNLYYLAYYLKALIFIKNKNNSGFKQNLVLAEKYAIKLNNKSYIGKCIYHKSTFYNKKKDNENELKLLNKALGIFKEINDSYTIGNIEFRLGHYYFRQKLYKKALNHYLTGFQLLDSSGINKQYCYELCDIGKVYKILNKPRKADEYYKLALERSDRYNLKEMRLYVLETIFEFYIANNSFKKAKEVKGELTKLRQEVDWQKVSERINDVEERYKNSLRKRENYYQRKREQQTQDYLKWEKEKRTQVKEIVTSLHKSLKQPIQSGNQILELLQRSEINATERQTLIEKIRIQFKKVEQINQALFQSFESEAAGKKEDLKAQNIITLLHKHFSGEECQEVVSEDYYPQTHFIKQYISNLAQVSDAERISKFISPSRYMGIML